MAFPRALRLVRDAAAVSEVVPRAAEAAADTPHVREANALLAAIARDRGIRTTKTTALQVPAFQKALKTYTHTIATFPLREYVGGESVAPRGLLVRPDRSSTYWSVMTRTVADVLLYDVAYWRIVSRSWTGYPDEIVHMPADQVTEFDGAYQYNSRSYTGRDIIRFDGDGLGGWLVTGANAITTAAALEAAALRYAEYPLPTIILKNTGADLPGDQVDQLLDAWEAARTNRATAYLNSTLETKEMGWNAADLQLVDARNAAAIQMARIANLDPIWTGAGVPGSSLTYSNRTDLYRQLLDTALSPVMAGIAQRLTSEDVTPRGHTVTFDTSVFLKANPQDIAQLIATVQPYTALTVDEARALLDLPALGVTP